MIWSVWTSIWAQSAGSDPLPLVGYGVGGAVIAGAMMGLIWFKPAVDDLRKRAERAEEQRDKLLEVTTNEIIPKLGANTEAYEGIKVVMEKVIRELERIEVEEPPRRKVVKRTT